MMNSFIHWWYSTTTNCNCRSEFKLGLWWVCHWLVFYSCEIKIKSYLLLLLVISVKVFILSIAMPVSSFTFRPVLTQFWTLLTTAQHFHDYDHDNSDLPIIPYHLIGFLIMQSTICLTLAFKNCYHELLNSYVVVFFYIYKSI